MKKHISLVYNAKSGSSLTKKELQKKCTSHDLIVDDFASITHKKYLKKITSLVSRKKIIVAAGGDGTINAAAAHMVHTSSILAAIPSGTLNNFTKDIGIPQDIDAALQNIHTGKSHLIDTGSVNDVLFLNNSSIGLYPRSLSIREGLKGKMYKWPAALYAAFRAFLQFRLYNVEIKGYDVFKTPFIFIGNNRYHINNFGFTDRKRLDEGVLCVYVIKTTKRRTFAKLFFLAARGKLHEAEEFEVFTTDSVQINTRKKRLYVSHDGEVSRLYTPLRYSIQKKSLHILH